MNACDPSFQMSFVANQLLIEYSESSAHAFGRKDSIAPCMVGYIFPLKRLTEIDMLLLLGYHSDDDGTIAQMLELG